MKILLLILLMFAIVFAAYAAAPAQSIEHEAAK